MAARPHRLVVGALLLLLAACANQHEVTAQHDRPDEIPEGPGAFSGEDGEFVLYRR